MSDTVAGLRRKIDTAGDLQSVVRTMKALAASNIGQYERSLRALTGYYHAVELGLGACFRATAPPAASGEQSVRKGAKVIAAVVLGSDQGLVGRFNEVAAEEAIKGLAALQEDAGRSAEVWAVGERVHARLVNAGVAPTRLFAVPSSVRAITALVGEILVESETRGEVGELHLFYNRPTSGALYAPIAERLLPLDEEWRRKLVALPWPTKAIPDVVGGETATLRALVREYLFVSLFRACAESLASENASRLAAMERADKNISDLLETLEDASHRLRQSDIDEELFDVVAGFEALSKRRASPRAEGKSHVEE